MTFKGLFNVVGRLRKVDPNYEETPTEPNTESDNEAQTAQLQPAAQVQAAASRKLWKEIHQTAEESESPASAQALQQNLRLGRQEAAEDNSLLQMSKKIEKAEQALAANEPVDTRGIMRMGIQSMFWDDEAMQTCTLCSKKIKGIPHITRCAHHFHFRCVYESLLQHIADVGASPIPGCNQCQCPLEWTYYDCQMAHIQGGRENYKVLLEIFTYNGKIWTSWTAARNPGAFKAQIEQEISGEIRTVDEYRKQAI